MFSSMKCRREFRRAARNPYEHPALTFAKSPSRPANYVKLRADVDVIVVISNCPQVNNPCNSGKPTQIKVLVLEPPSTTANQ